MFTRVPEGKSNIIEANPAGFVDALWMSSDIDVWNPIQIAVEIGGGEPLDSTWIDCVDELASDEPSAAALGSISGSVTEDFDKNNYYEGDEPLENVVFALLDEDHDVLAMMPTDSNGELLFI